ncbi:MAG TPA: DUF4389 domain-containing protein [Jatrophihabitantaceae bacterium]|nr:DUF4389 domain-containing protein [Jatrophihabitantaceae bacterium]
MEPSAAAYPATFTFDPPEKVTNWRPLVNWLLAIPHFAVLYALRILAQVIAVISWFVILFTGDMPDTFANLQAMWMRYEQRVYTFATFMREEYPPFAFATTTADDGQDPRTRVDVQPVLTDRDRLSVGLRIFYVIPHVVCLIGLGIYAAILVLINFFIVLFTGEWNAGMRDTVIKVQRWYVRVSAYFLLLTDEYPPFTLD